MLTPHQYHKKGGQPPCGRTLLRPTHRAGSNAARNVQRLLKKCARDWNGCAAKKIPVSSNRYFFAGRAGAMESPTRAVVEPAVRRREATKARVAPKQVAACGYLPSLLSQTRRKLATEESHLYQHWKPVLRSGQGSRSLLLAQGQPTSLFGRQAPRRLLQDGFCSCLYPK